MNLYRLELKKIKIATYLWAMFFIYIGILTLSVCMLLIVWIEGADNIEKTDLFTSWLGMLSLTTALSFACYGIFSAVIAAKVIVAEYCGKIAAVLLTYPIMRRQILETKCLLVCALTTVSTLISNLSIVGIVYVLSSILQISLRMDARHFIALIMCVSIFVGIQCSALGLISSGIGMKKRSMMTTIVSALLIICLTANLIAVSPKHIVFVMLAMTIFFVVIACCVYRALAYGVSRLEV